MTDANEIRSVIVAGTGPEAWIIAGGLARAFANRKLDVQVVDTGPTCSARTGRWTLPSQRGMHALLGIPEPQFLLQTGATFKLATEFRGWQGKDSRFLHAHGEIGVDIGGTPFYKFLQSEAIAGRAERPETFAIAGAAAALGKFARPMGEDRALSSRFTYAFHVDDARYTQYLREHAAKLGVRAASAPLARVELAEDGRIDALQLTDGTRAVADYFIDCSGPEARLIGAMPGSREDWSRWLPCDRMWSGQAPALGEPRPVTEIRAQAAGWSWRAPLAQASMVGLVFSSRHQDESSALAALREAEPALQGEPVLTRFSAGRRRQFWERNCVAIGGSAIELEPLAGADLHLAQVGLANFIELFPRERGSTIESAEYSRVMAEYADALRDFTLAHYHAGPARSGEFWSALRGGPLPESLAQRLDLYAASGRLNMHDHEPFEEVDWAWLLIGSGCRPESLEQHVRLYLGRLSSQEVAALRQAIQQLAASMPPHQEFLRRQAAMAARAG